GSPPLPPRGAEALAQAESGAGARAEQLVLYPRVPARRYNRGMDTVQSNQESDPQSDLQSEPQANGNGEDRKPWWFPKGVSGNPGGVPKDPEKAEGKVPELLRDMRTVRRQDESKDRTPGQRECRAWLKEDRKGFLGHLSKLEVAYAESRGAEGAGARPEPPAPDKGLDLAVDVLEKALAEVVKSSQSGKDDEEQERKEY